MKSSCESVIARRHRRRRLCRACGSAAAAAADWSSLPADLVSVIVEKVKCSSLSDYIRFNVVCKNWRLVQEEEMIKLPDQLPLLLIPYPLPPPSPAILAAQQRQELADYLYSEGPFAVAKMNPGRFYSPKDTWLGLDHTRLEKPTRTIYSLYDRKVHNDDIQLPVPYFLNVRGSSHGWLVAIREDEDFSVRLMNPFRSVDNEIQLPPLSTIDDIEGLEDLTYGSHCLCKAYVSASPSSVSNPSDIVVMATYDLYRPPAFCRPGDASWTCLEDRLDYCIHDAIYYKDQFYAIQFRGSQVMAFDVSLFRRDHQSLPKVTKIAEIPDNVCDIHVLKKYLVECGGELLQVRRGFDQSGSWYKTFHFQVYKLDVSNPKSSKEWVEVNTLNGYSLFLGSNSSMSLLASDFPSGCCKPNCIYFTDDYHEVFVRYPCEGPKDMGVFSLVDESIEPHYWIESKTIMPNAIWIQPML